MFEDVVVVVAVLVLLCCCCHGGGGGGGTRFSRQQQMRPTQSRTGTLPEPFREEINPQPTPLGGQPEKAGTAEGLRGLPKNQDAGQRFGKDLL